MNRPIPKNYPGHPADPVDVTEALRPLTTKERSLIQTFPEDFIFTGTKTNMEQAIGNAVPVKLGEFIANCIQEYISDVDEGKTISHQQLEIRFLKTKEQKCPPSTSRSPILEILTRSQ